MGNFLVVTLGVSVLLVTVLNILRIDRVLLEIAAMLVAIFTILGCFVLMMSNVPLNNTLLVIVLGGATISCWFQFRSKDTQLSTTQLLAVVTVLISFSICAKCILMLFA